MGGGGGLLQESWLPNTQAASYTNTISEYFTIGARLSSTLYHGHDTASKVGIKDIATLCLWEKNPYPDKRRAPGRQRCKHLDPHWSEMLIPLTLADGISCKPFRS